MLWGKCTAIPQIVTPASDPAVVGDEAVLIAQKTACAMVVAPDRVAAVKQLLTQAHCDVVISDDGLQHYALGRDIEIAVVDGERRFGNGYCLPAGPLREPIRRLSSLDFIVTNGGVAGNSQDKISYNMALIPGNIYNMVDSARILQAAAVTGTHIHAVAGIGNPQRFFTVLRSLGFSIIEHIFPDHHPYQPHELNFGAEAIIVMTEKDAVKCKTFADARYWCLTAQAAIDAGFCQTLLEKVQGFTQKDTASLQGTKMAKTRYN